MGIITGLLAMGFEMLKYQVYWVQYRDVGKNGETIMLTFYPETTDSVMQWLEYWTGISENLVQRAHSAMETY